MTTPRVTNEEVARLLSIIEKPADQLTSNDQVNGYARALMVVLGTGYTAEQKAKCQRVADYLKEIRRQRAQVSA